MGTTIVVVCITTAAASLVGWGFVWWFFPCPWCRPGNGRVPIRHAADAACAICHGSGVSLRYGRRYK